MDRPGNTAGRQCRPGLVPRPRNRATVTGWTAGFPHQPPGRGGDRQHQAGLGDVSAPSRHSAGGSLVADGGGPLRRERRSPASFLVGCEPVSHRRPLDERYRSRHPPDLVGLGPSAARGLAKGWRPVRAQRRCCPADRLAPGIPGRIPQPGLIGQQPRRCRGGRTARCGMRLSLVRPVRPMATECHRTTGARAGREYLPRRSEPGTRDRLPPFRPRARAGRGRRGRRARSRPVRCHVGTPGRDARLRCRHRGCHGQASAAGGRGRGARTRGRRPRPRSLGHGHGRGRCSGGGCGLVARFRRWSRRLACSPSSAVPAACRDHPSHHVVSPTPGWSCCVPAPKDGPEIWCRCDGGPHGFLSIAAHAHADALSVEVRHDGVDILTDPGTYCYHGEPEWREWFRSTAAHNTVEVGGASQSESGGPFLWTTQAQTRTVTCEVGEQPVQTWTAEHDGYRRLSTPTVHRRSVTLDSPGRSPDGRRQLRHRSRGAAAAFLAPRPRRPGRTGRIAGNAHLAGRCDPAAGDARVTRGSCLDFAPG